MAYNKTIWVNDDGTGTVGTPCSANNFNKMEDCLEFLDGEVTSLKDNVSSNAEQTKALDDKINVLNNRTLAPALSNVIPDALYIGDEWTGISCVRTDHGTVNAPPNCLIGVRTMKKLNDDNVIVNIENTQNDEKWTNTWNGSTWLGWQQIATTIVAIPTPANGWTQYEGHQKIKLIKTGKMVNLVGFANVGVTTANTIMLTGIPEGFRPSSFVQAIRVADLDVRVTTEGTMVLMSSKAVSYACYNSIYWEV